MTHVLVAVTNKTFMWNGSEWADAGPVYVFPKTYCDAYISFMGSYVRAWRWEEVAVVKEDMTEKGFINRLGHFYKIEVSSLRRRT